MGKSLTESAAEILSASLGAAAGTKEKSAASNAADDLGGETLDGKMDAIGATVAAKIKPAEKPGTKSVPAEEQDDEEGVVKEESELTEEEIEAYLESLSEEELAELANLSEEDDVELTEEEIEEFVNSLSEEELLALVEAKDEDEEDEEEDEEKDEDEEEDKKEVKEEASVELTPEQIEEARKKSVKAMVADNMGSCKEDIDALFNGEALSEDFKGKATTIFEAAVRARVESIVSQIVEENEATLDSTIADLQEQMVDQIDEYLNTVVEQWLEDNQVAIETGLRAEIAEDFINGLKNLFTEHYIEVPEDKADLVEELASRVADAEKQLSEQAKVNEELSKRLNEAKAAEILRNICEGLTSVQAEKIKTLAEGVEFTTEGEYSSRLAVIRENYFPTGKKTIEAPKALVETEAQPEVNDRMSYYVSAITKQLPK